MAHTPSFLPRTFLVPPLYALATKFLVWHDLRAANLSQSQAGKDVFSTIARCQGQGLWFRACGSVAAVKGGKGSNRGRPALTWVSGECEGPGGSGGIFLVFKGLFFYVLEDGGLLVCRFQLNMMDQTSWKINTQSETHTLSFPLLHIE